MGRPMFHWLTSCSHCAFCCCDRIAKELGQKDAALTAARTTIQQQGQQVSAALSLASCFLLECRCVHACLTAPCAAAVAVARAVPLLSFSQTKR